jgi:pimeloyl-ACP methyl ester carboxylesterase
MSFRILATCIVLCVAPGALAAQEPGAHDTHVHPAAPASTGARMPLLTGLGDWSWTVTTRVPAAQQYFDQGLRLAYAFNHDEAVLSFREALHHDPSCAMCAWGVAYALSPNINMPMPAEAEVQALAAIRQAAALAGRVTQRERDLIAALSLRFGEPPGAGRAARDSAYATAMRRAAQRYTGDDDVQVLFADAMLNLRPWNQWTRSGAPQPGTLEVVATLERVLARNSQHAGACHFYVHTVEASTAPERALDCAKRLPLLMPAAGHLVHMPAHVYLRVGMYDEAARANIAAVEADRHYFATRDVSPGIYPLFYAPHNLHFLWAAYMLSGQHEKALEAARALVSRVSTDDAQEEASLQAFLPSVFLTHVRFGNWSAALAEPAPADRLDYVRGMWHYARGVAFTAAGDLMNGSASLDSLRAIETTIPEDMVIILNSARDVLHVARLALEGRLASAHGDVDIAVTKLREAVAAEDELTYDEPPPWYEPARQVLGSVLLAAGRSSEAEAVFREDLQWVRENGWSLRGLEKALHAQGDTAEAAAVSARLQKAWQHADASADVALQHVRFRTAVLPTGVVMRYAEAGSGRPVVLLHGLSDSWYSFSRVLPLLSDGYRIIAPDLRGHGGSHHDGADFSMDAMAADVAALLDHLGIAQAAVVGHSMGAVVAQALAVHHGPRVGMLVLAASPLRGEDEVIHALRSEVLAQPEPMPAEFIRGFQEGTVHAPLPAAFLERVIAESSRLSSNTWRRTVEGLAEFDYARRLPRNTGRTFIIAGEEDVYFPLAVQQELQRSSPGARLITYASTGHALHWERPDRFAADLRRLLQESDTQRSRKP